MQKDARIIPDFNQVKVGSPEFCVFPTTAQILFPNTCCCLKWLDPSSNGVPYGFALGREQIYAELSNPFWNHLFLKLPEQKIDHNGEQCRWNGARQYEARVVEL